MPCALHMDRYKAAEELFLKSAMGIGRLTMLTDAVNSHAVTQVRLLSSYLGIPIQYSRSCMYASSSISFPGPIMGVLQSMTGLPSVGKVGTP